MEKKLSIITPLYNTKREFLNDLAACLEPYQSEIEWILVNDSPDNNKLKIDLAEIIKPYMVIVTNDKNRGIFYSYYQGYMSATARYCCILDHDDVFMPGNVLRELESDPDMIYTNEYKFDESGRREVYRKPEFDMLSSVFYFYTHHVTVMRTDIIQIMLREKGVDGKYTSIFDIHLMLEYMNYFVGRNMQVIHIKSADYGWRMHEASTALNLEQKLSGYFERVRKVEEFLKEHNETPILNIHRDIGYLIEGNFLSAYDRWKFPLSKQKFIRYLENSENDSIRLIHRKSSRFTGNEYDYFFNLFLRLPIKYLMELEISVIYLPTPEIGQKLGGEDYLNHVVDVPFMKTIEYNGLNRAGIWIKMKKSIPAAGKAKCIMMKDSRR